MRKNIASRIANGEEVSGLWGPANPAVQMQRENAPVNIPVWEKGDKCNDINTIPKGHISGTVLVVTQSADRIIISLDSALARNENKNAADNIWVIGYCE